jgi:hypothetical protein
MTNYNICPNKEAAVANINAIEKNLRYLGVLSENERYGSVIPVGSALDKNYSRYAHVLPSASFLSQYGVRPSEVLQNVVIYQETSNNPEYLELDEYEIYNYLNETAKTIWKDNTVIPHAIDYQVHVTPRLDRLYTFGSGGLLERTRIRVIDFNTDQELKPVLQVDEQYTLEQDGPYPAAQSVKTRTKQRQWFRIDGTLRPDNQDVKETIKLYRDINQIRNEGQRRRSNITNNTSQGCVYALVITKYLALNGGDPIAARVQAEGWLVSMLDALQGEKNLYDISGLVLPDALAVFTDGFHDDYLDNVTIPNIPEIQADPYASRGIGLTIRQYLVDSFKGLI